MAISAATKTSDFSGFLPAAVAAPIFEQAARSSVVQRLARQIPLGPNGVSIPVVTGRPSVGWVDEGAQKPASNGSMELKSMTPKKVAAIIVNSAEVVRANPGGYLDNLRPQLAEAFAIAFDYAALHDLGPDGTGTGPFATFIDQTTKSVELGSATQGTGGVYKDLVNAIDIVISDTDALGRRYRVTGFALDDMMEVRLLGSVDTTGRPLWVDMADGAFAGLARPGRLLGRNSVMGQIAAPDGDIQGYAGDWSQAAWGVVGGISYDVSDQATVTINGTLTSLWEHNLVAIRAEAEYGFLCADPEAFVEIRNDSGS